jgi:hypothetical protein
MVRKIFCALLLLPALASADTLNFSNINSTDFENISKEMSGNFMHHSVQGAAPLGNVFGFEVGVVGGMENSPNIDEIVTRSGGSGLKSLYHAGLLGVVSVPFGITGEVMVTPKLSSKDAEFQTTSAALKLSLNSSLLTILPFNLALRGIYSDAKFSFQQSNSGSNVNVENETKVSGLQILASPNLPVIEPYAGVGFLTGKNSLSAAGGSIFAPGYTAANSSENTVKSTQVLLGVTANLLIFRLGAEYSNAFGASSYTGKLAFGF